MTDRVTRMIRDLRVNSYPLCVEQFRLACDSLEQTAGEPMVLRRAKLHAHVLDNITIFLEDGDLLCGSGASKPFGMEMQYEYGVWTHDEVQSLKSEIYSITPEDEAELYRLNERFAENPANANLVDALTGALANDEQMWPFMKSGVILPPWKDRKTASGGGYAMSGYGLGPGFFLVCLDFERILREGAQSVVDEARSCLDNPPDGSATEAQRDYWSSVVIVFEAWIRFANRYAALAESMAAAEPDPVRQAELSEMARICRRVPQGPARTFREALQSFWFTFLMACPSPTASAGRFDQYMYPFYRRDIDDGTLSDDDVLELLEILRIKVMKVNRVSGQANRAKNAGMAKWHNWTIGGRNADGSDATNDLTYLLLEAARRTRLPHHTLTLRVHEGTPPELLRKSMEVVKTGIGMPAFIGDPSYIEFFTGGGMPVEEAHNYCATGCVDGNIPAVTRSQVVTFFVVPQAFDVFLHNGVCRYTGERVGIQTGDVTLMTTFEEFKTAFFRQLYFLMELACKRNNVELLAQRDLFPDPFRSALMRDGVRSGTDMLKRKFTFENASLLGAVGGVNTGDSLTAVKTLVYDTRRYTMAELVAAVDADWVGYEAMRRDFAAAPKYGNNDDAADDLVAEVYQFYADACYSMGTAYGGTLTPNAISITAHQPGGAVTGATPDGRRGGEILADASLSPVHGKDRSGLTAVLWSAMKVNQDPYQGTLMNMKVHPSTLRSDGDLAKLGSFVQTYLTNGGKHIQFNVVRREDMEEAKVVPEAHSDLVVRVAGYSAYFTRLPDSIQDEVISRTAHDA
jgi:formate C-acetyltransferase